MLIEHLSDADEGICDKFLNEEPISDLEIAQAIRRATTTLKFVPVFMGSAIKNTAVQPLLDGVCAYLPDPSEVHNQALDAALPMDAPPVPLVSAADAALVGLAFKLEEGRFGQLTYMRVYQGSLKKGAMITNVRTGKRVKVPRLVKMHSNEMEVGHDTDLSDFRMSTKSRQGRFAPCLVWIALPETPLPTERHRSRWLVHSCIDLRSRLTLDLHVCPRPSHLLVYPT